MDMTVNTEKPVDTQTILGSAGTEGGTAVQATDETDAVSGENLIVEEAEEKTAAGSAANANEIDAPTGTTDSDIVNEVYDLIDGATLKDKEETTETLANLLTNEKVVTALTTASTSTTQSAMFCLYRILALLLEVGEEEREAARTMRQAETENLISQMEDQRQALLDTAVASLVSTCVINTVMAAQSGYSIYQMKNAVSMENDSARMTGRSTFAKISDMAANPTDEKIASVKNDAAKVLSNSTIEQMNGENKTFAEYKSEWKGVVKEFRAKAEAGTITDADRTKMNVANAKLEYAAVLEANRVNSVPDVSQQQAAEIAFKANTSGALKNEPAGRIASNTKDAATIKSYEDTAKQTLGAEATKGIDNDFAAAKDSSVYEKYQADYKNAAEGSAEKETAGVKLTYAAAQEAKRINSLSTVNSAKTQAKVEFKHAAEADYTKSVITDKATNLTAEAQSLENRTRVKAQLFETVGRLAQAGVDYAKELMNSQAKEYDQTIELAKFNRDTSTDLVQTAMDLFKGILNVLKTVIDAEDRNIQEIMG